MLLGLVLPLPHVGAGTMTDGSRTTATWVQIMAPCPGWLLRSLDMLYNCVPDDVPSTVGKIGRCSKRPA